MGKSNAKRILCALPALLACAVIAAGIYVYPRRAVSSMFDLVPPGRMIACVRLRDLASVWGGCKGLAFVKKLRAGGIYPMRENRVVDERFKRVWQYVDNPYWPELLGRDCMLALYLDRDGGVLSGAVWSRVGFKARCVHLWELCWARLPFRRERMLERRREGKLTVMTVMDRKRKSPRFSYALIGDLAIATEGSGERFWKRVDGLAAGRERGDVALMGKGIVDERPHGERPGGGFFVDLGGLNDCFDARLHAMPPAAPADALSRMENMRGWVAAAAGEWRCLRGTFDLDGGRMETDVSVTTRERAAAKEGGGVGRRDPLADPLARLMERRGLLYFGSRCDPRELVRQFHRMSGAGAVELVRREGTAVLPADHFTLSWLGDDVSLLLYQDENGLVNAAASLLVNDRRLARERIGRFLNRAHGAKLRLIGRDGREAARLKKPLDVKLKRHGREPYCLLETGDPVERIYKTTLAMYGDRLLIAAADSILGDLDSAKSPPGRGWMAPAQAHCVVEGSALARAAASLKQILEIVAPFVERRADQEMIESTRQMLCAMEWLAPVREAWATAGREGGEVRVRCRAQFADISGSNPEF